MGMNFLITMPLVPIFLSAVTVALVLGVARLKPVAREAVVKAVPVKRRSPRP